MKSISKEQRIRNLARALLKKNPEATIDDLIDLCRFATEDEVFEAIAGTKYSTLYEACGSEETKRTRQGNPQTNKPNEEVVMAKGAYTLVRETIAPRIEKPNSELVQICKRKLPRVPLATIKTYVARAAWELRKEKKNTKGGKRGK